MWDGELQETGVLEQPTMKFLKGNGFDCSVSMRFRRLFEILPAFGILSALWLLVEKPEERVVGGQVG